MEKEQGSLEEYLQRMKKAPTTEELFNCVGQIDDGLLFLKSTLKMAHRDLKPGNILVRKFNEWPLQLKITDLDTFIVSEHTKTMTIQGTIKYMAPEVLQAFIGSGEARINAFQADIYSVGLILLRLLIGKKEFD